MKIDGVPFRWGMYWQFGRGWQRYRTCEKCGNRKAPQDGICDCSAPPGWGEKLFIGFLKFAWEMGRWAFYVLAAYGALRFAGYVIGLGVRDAFHY